MAKKDILNREMGDGDSMDTKDDESLHPGKTGYHRSEFGKDDAENYRIADGMVKKDESESRDQGTQVHSIAHHSVTGELYSGDPARHGHMGKRAGGAGGKGGPKKEEM